MAMSTTLGTALSGMKTAQAQLDLVGRNIANVDTPGYTRKTLAQNSVVMAGHSAGVATGNITRQVSEGLLKSFLSNNSVTGNMSKQYEYLSKLDYTLGTPLGDNSIAASVSRLQTAFNDFATDATSSANRYGLISAAESISSRLNSLTKEIQKMRGDADMEISSTVKNINSSLDEISYLNDQIVKYTVLNYDGLADLQDKRDSALRELSGMIDITYFTRDNGELVIQTKEGSMLLDREPHYLSHTAVAEGSATAVYGQGGIGGIFVDGVDITRNIRDGELKGLIDMRDNVLPSLQSQLDELAVSLRETINQIHNRGTAYPQSTSELNGTRTFLDTANQNIQIENGDVRFIIFDKDGKQVATTTLGGDLGFTNGSIDSMTTAVETWLQSPAGANLPQASVSVGADGKLSINTGDSEYSISIVDESTSTPGSEQKDVTIKFDVNGDGTYDRSFNGFSNFFGLNNFFSTDGVEDVFESKVIDRNLNLGLNTITELEFSDMTNGLNYASVKVYPNDSIQSIADRINNDATLGKTLTAYLVPNGNGVTLRIMHSSGEQFEINEKAPGSGLLGKLGMDVSSVGASGDIGIRKDLKQNTGLIASGTPEFNTATGEYEINPAANSIANKMADAFTASTNFNQAGSLASTQTTFANYAATFVGSVATLTSTVTASYEYQAELTNSISTKEAEISGVDIDEELGQMILFQQSYSACAKSFTAAKEMMDMLLSIV